MLHRRLMHAGPSAVCRCLVAIGISAHVGARPVDLLTTIAIGSGITLIGVRMLIGTGTLLAGALSPAIRGEIALLARLVAGDAMVAIVRCAVLDTAVTADQAMVAVIAAVRLIMRIGAGLVFVPAAVRAEITVGVVGAIRTIMGIDPRFIVAVWMIRTVSAVPCIVSRSDHAPRMSGVAGGIVLPPGMVSVVVIVGDVLIDDRLVDVSAVVVAELRHRRPSSRPRRQSPSRSRHRQILRRHRPFPRWPLPQPRLRRTTRLR